MADKVAIDDAMITRFRQKQIDLYGTATTIDCAREILKSALNPPADPDIKITSNMLHAAAAVFALWPGSEGVGRNGYWSEIYTAMERVRRMEESYNREKETLLDVSKKQRIHARSGDSGKLWRDHRRKDDP